MIIKKTLETSSNRKFLHDDEDLITHKANTILRGVTQMAQFPLMTSL